MRDHSKTVKRPKPPSAPPEAAGANPAHFAGPRRDRWRLRSGIALENCQTCGQPMTFACTLCNLLHVCCIHGHEEYLCEAHGGNKARTSPTSRSLPRWRGKPPEHIGDLFVCRCPKSAGEQSNAVEADKFHALQQEKLEARRAKQLKGKKAMKGGSYESGY